MKLKNIWCLTSASRSLWALSVPPAWSGWGQTQTRLSVMYWCVHEGWDQGSPAGSFPFLSCWHPENVICSGWSEAHRQLPSEGGTNISVLIGLRLFDLKVEQKLFLNAKNSSGGRLFSDLKLRLLYYKPFRDLNREAIYQSASWLLHMSIPAFVLWLQTVLLVNCYKS